MHFFFFYFTNQVLYKIKILSQIHFMLYTRTNSSDLQIIIISILPSIYVIKCTEKYTVLPVVFVTVLKLFK